VGREVEGLEPTLIHAPDAARLVGQAVTALATGAALAELPAAPDSEAALVKTAAIEGVAGLRDRCRQVKAAAIDEARRYERIRRSRRLRHWTDPDGAFRMDLRTTPDAGAEILAALEPHRDRLFDEARRCDRREGYDVYMADALHCVARGDAAKAPAKVQVRVDHSAFVRGHTVDGEICEIAGVGPIPVATARAYALDGFVAVVGVKDADVTAVAHLGRTIPARLRTVLEARDRVTCPVVRSTRTWRSTTSSPSPRAGRPSWRTWPGSAEHHYLKTHRGYRLEGGPGAWRWVPPRDTPNTS
jgi:hypothetical protein